MRVAKQIKSALTMFGILWFLLLSPLLALADAGDLDTSFDTGTGANSSVSASAIQADGKIIIGGAFTSFNGTARNRIARLNQDGSLDASFNPGTDANGDVRTIALQADGKILIGGNFTTFNGTTINRIARLNADGSLDLSFNLGSGANGYVYTSAIQADGKIIIGGAFTTFNRIARLNADGSLDSSFNPGSGASSWVSTSAIQADGKIIIGGQFTAFDGTARNRIARLNADGSLDTSFNPGSGADNNVFTSAVQADGKIIIGGYFTTFNGTARNYIARLNADGSLDSSFNPGSGASSTVYTSAVQADGKILIGGNFTTFNGTTINRIARLNADGSLDLSFNLGSGANGYVYTSAIQADGKIIIGGAFTTFNRIARLNADGSLDSSFNPGSGANNWVYTSVIQADGKIIIGGSFTAFNGTVRNYIARIHSGDTDADGIEDAADRFPFDPTEWFDTDGDGIGNNADGDDDNDTVLDGADNCPLNSNSNQLDGDGDGLGDACDYDFDNDGVADVADKFPSNAAASADTDADGFPNSWNAACDATCQSSSGLVLDNCPLNSNSNQLDGDGDGLGDACDYDFDNDGVADVADKFPSNAAASADTDADGFPNSWNAACDATCQSSSGLVLDNCPSNANADQLNTDGDAEGEVCDADDDNDGVLDTADNCPLNSNSNQLDSDSDIQGDVCDAAPFVADAASLDTSFNPGSGANDYVNTMAIQADGKIIIGGYFSTFNGTAINRIARLNTDGSLDTSFNPGSGADSTVRTIALQADGKIIIGGYFTTFNGTARNYIARLNADGSLDTSFNPGSGASNWVYASAIQADGKIIIGGRFITFNGTARSKIARLNADGSLDSSFNPGSGANNYYVYTSAVQADGKIIIGGDFTTFNGTTINRVARLNANGTLDTSFNPGSGANDDVNTMAIQADGRIVIGGTFSSYNGTARNHIARIHTGDADGDATDNNFNNDNIADLLIRSSSAGDWRLFNMSNGVASSSNAYAAYSTTDWQLVASEDFDADGDTDILLRNTTNGAWRMFITENGAVASDSNFGAYVSVDRSVESIADYNGDGTKDVLLHSNSGGAWRVFYVTNGTTTTNASMALYATGWSLQSAKDFDGDGDADIIMRDNTSGYWRIFTVQGGVVSSNVLLPLYANSGWTLKAAEDLDNDGDTDVVMRGPAGDWRVFNMQNNTAVSNAALELYLNLGWTLDHANDVDNDGDADLILRKPSTGEWRLFKIQERTVVASDGLWGLYVSTAWQTADTVDVDGNGVKDIILNNTSTGAWRAFMINAGVITSNTSPGLYTNTDWTLQNK